MHQDPGQVGRTLLQEGAGLVEVVLVGGGAGHGKLKVKSQKVKSGLASEIGVNVELVFDTLPLLGGVALGSSELDGAGEFAVADVGVERADILPEGLGTLDEGIKKRGWERGLGGGVLIEGFFDGLFKIHFEER